LAALTVVEAKTVSIHPVSVAVTTVGELFVWPKRSEPPRRKRIPSHNRFRIDTPLRRFSSNEGRKQKYQ
jgi:hypothetical protein